MVMQGICNPQNSVRFGDEAPNLFFENFALVVIMEAFVLGTDEDPVQFRTRALEKFKLRV